MLKLTKNNTSTKYFFIATLFLFIFFCSIYYIKFNKEKKVYSSIEKLVARQGEHFAHNNSSEYTLVEYFDFDCVYCRRLHFSKNQESTDYSQVNYVLRHYPAVNKTRSVQNNVIAECIYKQSGDPGYIKFLEEYYKVWGDKKEINWVNTIAYDLVSDKSALEKCIDSDTSVKNLLEKNYVQDNLDEISITPTVLVYKNNILVDRYKGISPKIWPKLIKYYSEKNI